MVTDSCRFTDGKISVQPNRYCKQEKKLECYARNGEMMVIVIQTKDIFDCKSLNVGRMVTSFIKTTL